MNLLHRFVIFHVDEIRLPIRSCFLLSDSRLIKIRKNQIDDVLKPREFIAVVLKCKFTQRLAAVLGRLKTDFFCYALENVLRK